MTSAIQTTHAKFVASHPAATWLPRLRSVALESLERHGFPTVALEDYRYTNLKPAAERAIDYLGRSEQPPQTQPEAAPAAAADALRIEVVNGRLQRLPEDLPAGLTLRRLSAGDKAQHDLIAAQINEAGQRGAGLVEFNAAFLTDALQIDVAPGVTLPTPLYLDLWSDGQPISNLPRVLVRCGDGSNATVIEHFRGTGAGSTNSVTQLACGTGAQLEYVKLQTESTDAHHLATQIATLAAGSCLNATYIDLGSALARNDLHCDLAGAGASASLRGAYLAADAQHLDAHIWINHRAPHTQSRATHRGIAKDRGRIVFDGKITVASGADGTDAALQNRNLLLNDGAEIDTKPELEIYADDVKCSHGATTGQLDPMSVFYLRSRGLTDVQARQMLIGAFTRKITGHIGMPTLRQLVESSIDDRISES